MSLKTEGKCKRGHVVIDDLGNWNENVRINTRGEAQCKICLNTRNEKKNVKRSKQRQRAAEKKRQEEDVRICNDALPFIAEGSITPEEAARIRARITAQLANPPREVRKAFRFAGIKSPFIPSPMTEEQRLAEREKCLDEKPEGSELTWRELMGVEPVTV